MRGIVGTVWYRVMYAGDYAADGLNSAVNSAWGLCHAGWAMLVFGSVDGFNHVSGEEGPLGIYGSLSIKDPPPLSMDRCL